ncbi:MAG: PEP-CTERM sorting domain-containing protein [Candidatus Omnitrophica bacterium]|nr:PEP-CTERM sorting domain-containing protein [Candidatus Omnitrophota bacterium]
MKKIFLIITLFLVSTVWGVAISDAAILLTQDFNSANSDLEPPPAGWDITLTWCGGGEPWRLNNNWRWNQANQTGGDGTCATIDGSYEGNFYGAGTDLVSPIFSLDGCYTSADLSFATIFDHELARECAKVEISTNNGSTWIDLLDWREDHSATTVNLDLTSYIGNDLMRVKFAYLTEEWPGGLWQVDDVLVSAVECSGGDTTPVPEPVSILLFGSGLAGLFLRRK